MTTTTTTTVRPARSFRRPPRKWLWLGAAVLLVAAVVAFLLLRKGGDADPYRTEAVARGEIVRSVSASGTLEALSTVQVGSQLSGQVTQVLVDYNDRVTRGQVLAILDPQTQRSSVEQAQAAVSASAASVAAQQANLAQAQAQVAVAQAAFGRQQTLFNAGIVAPAALETARAELQTAQAGVRTAQAQIRSAQAQVQQQQAQLRSQQTQLGRTVISAPISGVVIDRQIEPGQTVASGLNVAVLFTLAGDLSRVQALIRVDEADIGSVREGLPVRFTVDAFPNDNFTGVVTEVRKLPTTESNVVAYTVVVEADNPGQKLLPGMTANAEIILERRVNALRVPNAALRFTPAGMETPSRQRAGGSPFGGAAGGQRSQRQGGQRGGNQVARISEQLELDAAQKARIEPILTAAFRSARPAGGAAAAGQGGGRGGAGAGAGQRRGNPARAAALNAALDQIKPMLRPDQQTRLEALRAQFAGGGGQRGTVWVLRDGKPVPIPVRTGGTDGSYTEILGGRLREGDLVITGG
ncbi:MAG TPA: efflux RND transporter periplasmic adaptor subunit, partial [Caulobacteraceae bacterium]